MQFLVTETIATEAPGSPESARMVPDVVHAINDWIQAQTKQGKVKASWGYADAPGGAFVLDVASPEELTRLLTSFPSSALPHRREVHPVTTVAAQIGAIEPTLRESLAQMDAMMRQSTSSAR